MSGQYREPRVKYLDLEDLLALARDLDVCKVRDLGLLDAAAHRPMTSLMGVDAYPTVEEKAAVILESLVRNHPLVDGNKRLGCLSLAVFCAVNGVVLSYDDEALYQAIMCVAQGQMHYGEMAALIISWKIS